MKFSPGTPFYSRIAGYAYEFYMLTRLLPASEFGNFYKAVKSDEELLPFNIKKLGGEPVWLRADSEIDRSVLKYVFYHQYHLPWKPLAARPVILDIGTNIGLTVRHFKHLYPEAKVLGFEMDAHNFLVAQKNTAHLPDCKVYNQAVWKENGFIQYDAEADADAFSIHSGSQQEMRQVEAVTVGEILESHSLTQVDFMKMDIEGAEEEIFRAGDLSWLSKVRYINLEVHTETFQKEGMEILEKHGFYCRAAKSHWGTILAENRNWPPER
ncbi:MAG: FkbM family methyltransferase [Cytophagales bacterium]|nr:FkbM family methyltransferase [Cytophagales bacterium]